MRSKAEKKKRQSNKKKAAGRKSTQRQPFGCLARRRRRRTEIRANPKSERKPGYGIARCPSYTVCLAYAHKSQPGRCKDAKKQSRAEANPSMLTGAIRWLVC